MNTTTDSSEPSSPIAPPLSPLSPVTAARRLSHAASEREIDKSLNTASVYSHTHPPQTHQAPQTQPQPTQTHAHTTYITQPASQPFSSADSTDAIALRAAISSLQYQRQRATDDIRRLEQLKHEAVSRSDEFRTHLLSKNTSKPAPDRAQTYIIPEDEPMNDAESADEEEQQAVRAQKREVQDILNDIPLPQQIVRMPPINWEKYHVVAEPLERMHMAQQLRPGEHPGTLHSRESVVAAEYDALYDRVGEDTGTGHGGVQGRTASLGGGVVDERKDSHGTSTSGMVTRRGSKAAVQTGS
ncbi:hypothetical protein MBLNU457_g0865t1 [Dothideomycetes sp. NU457]